MAFDSLLVFLLHRTLSGFVCEAHSAPGEVGTVGPWYICCGRRWGLSWKCPSSSQSVALDGPKSALNDAARYDGSIPNTPPAGLVEAIVVHGQAWIPSCSDWSGRSRSALKATRPGRPYVDSPSSRSLYHVSIDSELAMTPHPFHVGEYILLPLLQIFRCSQQLCSYELQPERYEAVLVSRSESSHASLASCEEGLVSCSDSE